MANIEQQRERLINLLKALFQLDQPDLDFGFYRIMHARSAQVSDFLENDLLSIIREAFGEADDARIAETRERLKWVRQKAADDGVPEAAIEDYRPVREARQAFEAARETGDSEGDVYDHLYRFFERYYDQGDFMSRRYFARETDGKAAPYAIPYDGREVYLHWANRDQYYIKTSEYLTNFTFDPTQAPEYRAVHGALFEHRALKTHCRIIAASEGEHNNVKASARTERYFIIHGEQPVKLETGQSGAAELVIQFEYRADPEKQGQEGAWRKKRLKEAAECVKAALGALDQAEDYAAALMTPAPTEKEKDRTLLEKYIGKYAARNTMDYFIHKDLGGFLRRELDFYIKNEVMRLDDIESADAPRVESYLSRIKVLRRIGRHLIDFLAQLENFQKKLWLKKKFVVDTQYCITLDRIPEQYYPEIAANEAQREEWVTLFAIDDLDGYSKPLSENFLKANPFLVLDTAFFSAQFKDSLLATMQDLDKNLDGLLIHSENFQALKLMQKKMGHSVDSIYIDPPYNTRASEIIYKNAYKHSSWMSLMENRISIAQSLMKDSGLMCTTIDDVEFSKLYALIENQFTASKIAGVVSIRINPSGRPTEKGFALTHEYAIFSTGSKAATIHKMPRSETQLKRFKEKDAESIYEWRNLRREGSNSARENGERQYFPIFANLEKEEIRIPSMEWIEENRSWKILEKPAQYEVEIWPVNDSGREKNWRWSEENIRKNYLQFKAKIPQGSNKPQVYYKYRPNLDGTTPLTLWIDTKYSATEHGTQPLKDLFVEPQFSYPKSIYAVEDCLSIMGIKNPNTHILDFFAGSGTTAHAVINMSRIDKGKRRFTLCEMGQYFDQVTLPRIKKAVASAEWSNGKPENIKKAENKFKKQISEYKNDLKNLHYICNETGFEFHSQRLNGLIEYLAKRIEGLKTQISEGNFYGGISQTFKYIRLESYEDTQNNLILQEAPVPKGAADFQRDYLLHYWLEFETRGSPSLLNIQDFADPAAYKLKVKTPGTDEYIEKAVDLVETFNWLIGLHVEHLDRWHCYNATFKREQDPELPEGTDTRLILDGPFKETDSGVWRFRKIEGYTLRAPGDHADRERTLVIWRKLTGDMEKDNLMLDAWFKECLADRDAGFDVIYVNGSNNLLNLRRAGETWQVRLTEEHFHRAMWEAED